MARIEEDRRKSIRECEDIMNLDMTADRCMELCRSFGETRAVLWWYLATLVQVIKIIVLSQIIHLLREAFEGGLKHKCSHELSKTRNLENKE